MRSWQRLWPHLLAIVSTVLAVCVRLELAPELGARFPYAITLVVILLIGARYGLGPALSAAVVGGFGSVFLVPPVGEFRIEGLENVVGYSLYWVVAGIAVASAGAARDARQGAEARGDELRTTLEGIGDG